MGEPSDRSYECRSLLNRGFESVRRFRRLIWPCFFVAFSGNGVDWSVCFGGWIMVFFLEGPIDTKDDTSCESTEKGFRGGGEDWLFKGPFVSRVLRHCDRSLEGNEKEDADERMVLRKIH